MDLYPDSPISVGMMREGSVTARFFEWANRTLMRLSDTNVVLGRCMQERVLAKGVPADKVVRIPVWADFTGIAGTPRDESPYRQQWGLGSDFTVMYSGNLGIGHDAKTICQAMLRLKDESGLKFVFVGAGKRRAEVEAFVKQHNLSNAQWREYVPREQLGLSLAAGDVHLISLKEGCEGIMVPSKLFGVMAAGRAGIFIGNPASEIGRVLAEHDAGLNIREGDVDGLVKAIMSLKSYPARTAKMGENARQAVFGRYDKATATRQWAELIESLVKPRHK